MRTLIDHIVEGDSADHQLRIEIMDEPGAGGANHKYLVSAPSSVHLAVNFQDGPIREAGVNGVTQEVLLAIVIDRLRSFQAGSYACESNQQALTACRSALGHLQARTRARIQRGVEGTNQK